MIKNEIEKIVAINLDYAKQKAMTGQVLICTNGAEKKLAFVDTKDLKLNDQSIGEVVKALEEQNRVLVDAYNSLVDIVNENQALTTKAIDELRKELEKGKLL